MANSFLVKLRNKHFLSLAGNGIMSILGMITLALLYHSLSVAEIGVWIFFQSTLLLVDTFRSGFLTTAFIKFYAGSAKERSAEVAGSTWFVAGTITVILLLINIPLWIYVKQIDNEGLSMFFKWFGVSYLCTLPLFVSTCVLQAEQQFDKLLIVRLLNQGSFILFVLLLILLNKLHLDTVIYANLISGLLTSVIAIMTGWSRIKTVSNKTRSCVKELFDFGKYSVGTTISSNLFRSSDTFIINFMLGPAPLAVYNLGQRLMEIVEIPLRSFAATGMPSLSAAYNQNKKEEVIYTMKKYAGMLTVALIPVCIVAVLVADIPIALIGGGKYLNTNAANVFRIFMIFALLVPADRFLALTLDVIHKPKINFIKVLIMLAGNIIADFAGIYFFKNIYGVALASAVPVVTGVIIGHWALRKYSPFKLKDIFVTGYTEVKELIIQFIEKFNASAVIKAKEARFKAN